MSLEPLGRLELCERYIFPYFPIYCPFFQRSEFKEQEGKSLFFITLLSLVYKFFKKDFIYLFLERGREGVREGEKHQCVVASHTPPTGDLACNPGMCPDWESNWQPFGLQAASQSTEPHQPGLVYKIFNCTIFHGSEGKKTQLEKFPSLFFPA